MSNQIFNLKGRVVVITGGLGIQGPEHKKAFESVGAKVVVTDIKGGDFNMDVTDEKQVKDVVKKIVKDYGKIDVWVNNHGATGKQAVTDWDYIIKVNLTGTYLCCQAAAETMMNPPAGGVGGSIINIASIYGLVGPDFNIYNQSKYADKPMGLPAGYAASKGGVIALTKYLASLYAPKIRVNCVTPGGIFDNQDNNFVKKYADKTMLNRMANRNEVSGALLYLASDLSSYVTGENIVIDGGLTTKA